MGFFYGLEGGGVVGVTDPYISILYMIYLLETKHAFTFMVLLHYGDCGMPSGNILYFWGEYNKSHLWVNRLT